MGTPIKRWRTGDPDQFAYRMSMVTKDLKVRRERAGKFHTDVTLARLPRTAIFSVNAENLSVSVENQDFVGATIPVKGRFQVNRTKAFEPGSCHVLDVREPFKLTVLSSSSMLVVNFYRPLLKEIAANLHVGTRKQNHHDRRLDLDTPEGRSFWRYLRFVWSEFCRDYHLLRSPLVTKEMEDSLYALFAYASKPSSRLGSNRDSSRLSRYARLAEEYIVENLRESLSAHEIAALLKISYPTLYRAFRKYKETTPMQFVRLKRLEAVYRELIAAEPRQVTITEVAMRYGFSHMGQFSTAYKRTFGETPSETLRR